MDDSASSGNEYGNSGNTGNKIEPQTLNLCSGARGFRDFSDSGSAHINADVWHFGCSRWTIDALLELYYENFLSINDLLARFGRKLRSDMHAGALLSSVPVEGSK